MRNPKAGAVELRKPNIDFSLQSMANIYKQANGQKDVPHRHDYYTILYIRSASGKHVIDYQSYTFAPAQVHFVSPGQIHQVALEGPPSGVVITFSRDFLAKNDIPESFITNINLFRSFSDNPPLQLDREIQHRLNRLVVEMESCIQNDYYYQDRALGALIQLFLIYCNNSTELDSIQVTDESPGVCILRDFKQLVDTRFQDWHKVNDYSSQLHISSKHLSQTIKGLTGKSAKEVIQDRLLLEAKRLLLHTEMSVKEIGYEIGFEEPLHFSSFFKRKVGKSPSLFRA